MPDRRHCACHAGQHFGHMAYLDVVRLPREAAGQIEQFVNAALFAEREACAKIAETEVAACVPHNL